MLPLIDARRTDENASGRGLEAVAQAELPNLDLDSPPLAKFRKTPQVTMPDGAVYLTRTFACQAGSRDYIPSHVNTLSDKSDSFFGEPAYWPACTQQARSGPGFSVEKHLTPKSSLILGDLGRVLPTTLPRLLFSTAALKTPMTSQSGHV
jgi:hypothetical protein